MKKYINRKIFFILLSSSLISIACVFPYIISLQSETLKKIGQPVGLIFLAQLIQSLILFSVAIFFGLYFTKKINFQIPILEAIANKKSFKKILNDILGKSVLFGAAAAIIIYLFDFIFTYLGAMISTHQNYAPIWQKLLAALYGGISEEILMRLFLTTLFIWLGLKIFKH